MRPLAIAITSLIACATPAWAQVPFTDDFDSGEVDREWHDGTCCGHSLDLRSDPVRAGTQAARFELRRGDPNVELGKRSELSLETTDPRGEYWYGFSIFLPDDYARDTSAEIVAQWHGFPDMREGENWRSPPLALMTDNGRWRIARRHDARRVIQGNGNENLVTDTLGDYEPDRGRWVDWVFHIRWSWTGDGFVQIYKDRTMIYDHQGSVGFNDAEGPYLKVGIYKWDWSGGGRSDTNERILYLDEIRVRGADGNLASVSPGASPGGTDAGTPPGSDAGPNADPDSGTPAGEDGGAPPGLDAGMRPPTADAGRDAESRAVDGGVAVTPRPEPTVSGGCAVGSSGDASNMSWIGLLVVLFRRRR